MSDENLLALTADIVASHVSNNNVPIGDIPTVIRSVHAALAGLGVPVIEAPVVKEPAVSVRSSVKPDYIVCLEDGKKLKMLKRHLMTHYDLTPDQYRAKWKLPADYPMVAPNYAATRQALALKIGLGRKPKAPVPAPEPEVVAKPARQPRAKKLTGTQALAKVRKKDAE